MRWKKHKTDTTKDVKELVIGRRKVQEFIGRSVESSGTRDPINGVKNSKSNLSPKVFGNRSI
jgi:hypothetical protein